MYDSYIQELIWVITAYIPWTVVMFSPCNPVTSAGSAMLPLLVLLLSLLSLNQPAAAAAAESEVCGKFQNHFAWMLNMY